MGVAFYVIVVGSNVHVCLGVCIFKQRNLISWYFIRVFEKGFKKIRGRDPLPFSDDVHNVGERLGKGDKLKKQNIHCTDGAKYMSYVKVGLF